MAKKRKIPVAHKTNGYDRVKQGKKEHVQKYTKEIDIGDVSKSDIKKIKSGRSTRLTVPKNRFTENIRENPSLKLTRVRNNIELDYNSTTSKLYSAKNLVKEFRETDGKKAYYYIGSIKGTTVYRIYISKVNKLIKKNGYKYNICSICRKSMNPANYMLSPVCLECAKKGHKRVVSPSKMKIDILREEKDVLERHIFDLRNLMLNDKSLKLEKQLEFLHKRLDKKQKEVDNAYQLSRKESIKKEQKIYYNNDKRIEEATDLYLKIKNSHGMLHIVYDKEKVKKIKEEVKELDKQLNQLTGKTFQETYNIRRDQKILQQKRTFKEIWKEPPKKKPIKKESKLDKYQQEKLNKLVKEANFLKKITKRDSKKFKEKVGWKKGISSGDISEGTWRRYLRFSDAILTPRTIKRNKIVEEIKKLDPKTEIKYINFK